MKIFVKENNNVQKDRGQKTSLISAYLNPCISLPIVIWTMWSLEGQNMGMTSYHIIYLDLAAYVIGKIGNNSSFCIHNELLGLMGSLSSLKELCQLK